MSTATAPVQQKDNQQPQSGAALAPSSNQQIAKLDDLLTKAREKLTTVAPKWLDVDRMTRLLLAACGRTPKILLCTPESILRFAMKCSETGLEPIGAGGCWPIPYEDKKRGIYELTFMPDYRGMVNAAKRAECIKDAYAEAVYSEDKFDYELGLEPKLYHKPARGNRGELEAAYCILVFHDDTRRFVVMHKAEIESIRDRSQAWGAWIKWKKPCPWNTDPGEMWKKTVVRRAIKPFAGMSSQVDAIIQADDETMQIVDSPDLVPMPKAVGEGSTNGNHDRPATEQSPPDITNEAAEAEANERLARANQLLADIPLARKTWELQLQKHWKKTWSEMSADEQEQELSRMSGMVQPN